MRILAGAIGWILAVLSFWVTVILGVLTIFHVTHLSGLQIFAPLIIGAILAIIGFSLGASSAVKTFRDL
jgi:hypothetical protein